MFQEVFDIRERTLGPDHPDIPSRQNNLTVDNGEPAIQTGILSGVDD